LIRSTANKRREVCNHVGLVEITAPDSDIGPLRATAAGRNHATDSSDAGEELGTDVEHSAKSSRKVTCADAQIRCQLIDRKGGITAQTGGSLQYERLKANACVKSNRSPTLRYRGTLLLGYREALLPYLKFRTSAGHTMVSTPKFEFPECGTSRIRE
jgi:hypothetical protein